MTFEFARNAFALAGVVASLYVIFRFGMRFLQNRGDDAPIRVKGGSVKVFGKYDWELDDVSGDNEYFWKGHASMSLKVIAYLSEADAKAGKSVFTGNHTMVVLQVKRGKSSSDPVHRLTFRGTGALRLIDAQKRLNRNASDSKMLEDTSVNHWIESIEVKGGGKPEMYKFGADMKPVIDITPY